ncbi:MAG: carboxypeptidase M32 [Anaerolineaceae bacterium]|nr:carboxypeptidase M32 [Anaerolineaceae bacterium]
MSAYEQFEVHMAEINDLCCVINLLNWDSQTQMPSGGTQTRGHQISTVASLAQKRFVSEETLRLIEAAEDEISGDDSNSYRVRAVAQAREAFEVSKAVPAKLVGDVNALKTIAQQVWTDARQKDDFNLFAPYLEQMITMKRQIADAIGFEEHPYDAMLNRYEPGMTTARIQQLFAELKVGLDPILDRIRGLPQPANDFLTRQEFPVDLQKKFALQMVEKFGYDLQRGRVDVAVHPFEISFTRQDVRITTRYNPNYPGAAIFGLFHESGHGMYEQGADPTITRTVLATDLMDLYAVAGVSYGMHEAQARLWENLVGRSRLFWENHFEMLQSTFPEQLKTVELDAFYRAINCVQPSLIRVEADEVTYNYHIMLRIEVEAALMDGSLKVSDLPEFWNSKMQDYLGVIPSNNRVGVLQDVHWSAGYVGSFCGYSVGNVISAQIYEAASKQVPDFDEEMQKANYQPLLSWLTENIYKHGRAYSVDELVTKATGSPLNVKPYLSYLTDKYSQVYR